MFFFFQYVSIYVFTKWCFLVYDIFMIFLFSFMFYFMFLICFVEVPFSCLPFSVCVFLAIFRQIHQSFLACGWRSVQGSWFASQIKIKYAEGLQNFMSVMWLIRASVAQNSRGPKIEKTTINDWIDRILNLRRAECHMALGQGQGFAALLAATLV